MNASKHTPGPWHYYTFGGTEAIVFAPLVEKASQPIATVGFERQDFEANARLIAAAPDMLEILQRMIADATFIGDGYVQVQTLDLEAAERVIAKVEGKE